MADPPSSAPLEEEQILCGPKLPLGVILLTVQWPRPPGKQRHSYQAGYLKGISVIFLDPGQS